MEWIDVQERLPELSDFDDPPMCIVWDGISMYFAEFYGDGTFKTHSAYWWPAHEIIEGVTHWQPLPDPPQLLQE